MERIGSGSLADCAVEGTANSMVVLVDEENGKEEEEERFPDFGQISLSGSPHLDANVSRKYDETRNKHDAEKREATPSTKFVRSWSFLKARERNVTLDAEVKRKRSDLKIVLSRSQSWSLTKTASPAQVENGNVENSEGIEQHYEENNDPWPELPMPSIEEDEANIIPVPPVEPVKQAYKVRPLLRSLVAPSERTEKHWMSLSNLDRVVNPTFSSVIHYYTNAITETRTFSDLTNILKDSLAKTLVNFYPLAGRLTLREDGKVDLLCNDAGSVWIEALVDSDLESIGGAQPNHRLSGFDFARVGPGPIFVPDQETPMPALIIQVTRFTCGAIAIATSWHHTVADGFSGTHFMRSWAEVAQGKPISLKPLHSRSMLAARDPPNPTLVNGYGSSKSYGEGTCPEGANASTEAPAQLEKFDLNTEAIADLKLRANLEPPPFTPRPYTSAESISAYLWIQMTKARASANSYDAELARDQTTKFFMFVDGRKRLRLPAGYFGNVVCSACAVAREADILNSPLHYAAGLIRIATRNITEEYFRSLIDWVEIQGMLSSKSDHVNSLGHDVAATFWTFFPMYDIEFGWGKPVFAARNSPPRPRIDGIAMMPSAEGRGMVALLNLHSDRMSKLQRQCSFATVFHY